MIGPSPWPRVYAYPVAPRDAAYSSHHKRSHAQLMFLALAAVALFVIAATLLVINVGPTTQPCGTTCGPRIGPRLITGALYRNQQWRYAVEYDSAAMSISGQDQNGVQLQPQDGDGEIDFSAQAGSTAGVAVQNAVNGLDSSQFQNLQQIGPVRGAEVGLVPGQGLAFAADFVPPDGSGQAVPVGIVIMAAEVRGVTITVTAFSASTSDIRDAPYGLDHSQLFDFSLTNTIWSSS